MASSHSEGVGTMDILAAAFFIVAGAWLLVAVLYSTLVLIFLRLRSRGELGSIYSQEFGRVYLWRRGRGCYIPLGWVFRRYIAHLQYEPSGSDQSAPNSVVHFMTRDERRTAMETLLVKKKRKSGKKIKTSVEYRTATNNHAPATIKKAAAKISMVPTPSE